MKKLFMIGGLGLLVGGFYSCDKVENACNQVKATSALVESLPDSLITGSIYEIPVKFVLDNSCGDFKKFEVNQENYSIDIKLITQYEGCQCDYSFKEMTTNFPLQLFNPGNYSINFWISDNDYDEHLIKIIP